MKSRFVFENQTWNAHHIKSVGALKQCQGGWYFEIETPLGLLDRKSTRLNSSHT